MQRSYSSDVAGNETPILVIYGSHNNEALRQETTGPMFRAWYPNLTEHVCPSGHYPMLETPVDFAKAVQEYLLVG